jgi:hypothetical protein
MLPLDHCMAPAILLATNAVGMIARTGISTKESIPITSCLLAPQVSCCCSASPPPIW